MSLSKQFAVGAVVGASVPLLFSLIKALTSGEKGCKQLEKKRFVGIELGGTNYNVAIGEPLLNNKGQITDFVIVKRKNGITYADPQEALSEIIRFIQENQLQSAPNLKEELARYEFIGIASFGPLCLDKSSPLYGSITTTPKELWRGIRVLAAIEEAFPDVQTLIDTDVNAAALAEFKLGKHEVKESLAYVTIGTGVGVGVIAQGRCIHGLTHPEGGHIVVERSPEEFEHFQGVCPYHKHQTCLEGMVCNKSIAERLNVSFTALADIPDNSKVWSLIAFYLAQLCLNITLLLSPEAIVIGGGIMNRTILFDLNRNQFIKLLGGYVEHPLLSKEKIERYIVAPRLGSDVGVKGALALSMLE
jgi:fructokinase